MCFYAKTSKNNKNITKQLRTIDIFLRNPRKVVELLLTPTSNVVCQLLLHCPILQELLEVKICHFFHVLLPVLENFVFQCLSKLIRWGRCGSRSRDLSLKCHQRIGFVLNRMAPLIISQVDCPCTTCWVCIHRRHCPLKGGPSALIIRLVLTAVPSWNPCQHERPDLIMSIQRVHVIQSLKEEVYLRLGPVINSLIIWLVHAWKVPKDAKFHFCSRPAVIQWVHACPAHVCNDLNMFPSWIRMVLRQPTVGDGYDWKIRLLIRALPSHCCQFRKFGPIDEHRLPGLLLIPLQILPPCNLASRFRILQQPRASEQAHTAALKCSPQRLHLLRHVEGGFAAVQLQTD